MIKAIVTDIEGTTSSLSFVKDVLFPYARQSLPDFVERHKDQPEVQCLLEEAGREMGGEPDVGAVVAQFIRWLDDDKKITSLKTLQGLIWEAGYRQGDFKGHIYPDAAQCLQAWKKRGLDLYVYSSGSVYAQKLLFAHTDYGDLTSLFSGYFDTHIGGKKERGSYERIASTLNMTASQILFLSDIKEELDAAKSAGFVTLLLNRGGLPIDAGEHPQARDFAVVDASLLGWLDVGLATN